MGTHNHCGHSHGNENDVRTYRLGALVGILTFILQCTLVWLSGSNALLSDTIHLGSDTLVIIGAFLITLFIAQAAQEKKILVRKIFAFFGIVLLFIGSYHVYMEAQHRLLHPVDIANKWVLTGALIGGLGNLWVYRILHSADKNIMHTVVSWHLICDIAMSVAVGISALYTIISGGDSIDRGLSEILAIYMFGLAFYLSWKLSKGETHCH